MWALQSKSQGYFLGVGVREPSGSETSQNHETMSRSWYFKVLIWAAHDPQLARLMLEDVANYITTTNVSQGARQQYLPVRVLRRADYQWSAELEARMAAR
jgi:hypothetical protein